MLLTGLFTCMQAGAQSVANTFKGDNNANPISPCVFCADPTSLEYNGRLYVYGSNDHQQFIKNGKKGENSYGDIKSIVVFSTDDMVNWTFHGTIDTKKLCSGWVTNPWYQGYGVSWAPSVVWRTNDAGVDEFFLYFCNSSHGVGVLKANSPIGPWKSPLNKLLIHYDTPGANAIGTNANFDPGVVIDDNGVGWLSFGGLGPSEIMPEAARIVKLKPSMTAVDGSAVKIHAPYHFEANELNVIGGKFVYTYCSNWADRKDADWNKYKQEHGINLPKPDKCTMCYMVSDDPMNPDSWVYKGVYGVHPGNGANNNHSHLHKFQGNYYYIYHNAILKEKMKAANAIDSSTGIFRSICVNKATVNEETQKINSVTLNLSGVSPIHPLNPYDLQQAETMATCGGVSYEDFTNITKPTSISTLGNDASKNLQVKMKAMSWIMVRKADFGEGARALTVKVRGTGKLEVRLGTRFAEAAATLEFSSAILQEHTIEVSPEKFNGEKNVFFLFTEAENVYFDSWQFFDAVPEGIEDVEYSPFPPQGSRQASIPTFYDMSGRRLMAPQPGTVVIERYKDSQGVVKSRKVRR